MTPKFHTLKVKTINQETEDTVSVSFDVPEDLQADYQYNAGQYLTLRTTIDGEDLRRSYSLCSAPFEAQWKVAIKMIPNGKFSTFAKTTLKSGDEIQVMTPTGHFALHVDPIQERSYVFFAAGSGITPVLAMIKTILREEPKSDVTLFYGNKGFANVIFREELEALKNQFMAQLRIVHIFSRESLGNALQKGRIDLEKCNQLFKAFLSHTKIFGVYVCGPEEMIYAVKESMMANGVAEENVHFELFTTPGAKQEVIDEIRTSPTIHAHVSIIIDGDKLDIEMDSNKENILDAAQKSGADLPYACKGGVCCTCKAKLLEGTARMEVNYGLEKDEIENGYILTCQSHPTSEKLVVSFDD